MICCQIGSRLYDLSGCLDEGECITPAKQGVARFAARLARFANEDVEQFTEDLDRNEHGPRWLQQSWTIWPLSAEGAGELLPCQGSVRPRAKAGLTPLLVGFGKTDYQLHELPSIFLVPLVEEALVGSYETTIALKREREIKTIVGWMIQRNCDSGRCGNVGSCWYKFDID
jgi:hypothetical protein